MSGGGWVDSTKRFSICFHSTVLTACAALSPGTLSALREIEYCSDQGLPHYYLGYFVAGSPKMDYKARFRPNEILLREGAWVPFRE